MINIKYFRLAALMLLLAAGALWGGVGSVVSSFQLSNMTTPYALGIYRDDTRVYAILTSTSGTDYLRSFTPTGSVIGSAALASCQQPRDADHSLLGSNYIAILDYSASEVISYTKSGSRVSAFGVPTGTTAYGYIPGAPYYYLARSSFIFRYTTSGSMIASFYGGGTLTGIGASPAVNGLSGEYVLISRSGGAGFTNCFTSNGSLVCGFIIPASGTEGSVVGPATIPAMTRTYWANQYNTTSMWAYQVDIGGTGSAVVPSSVGRVKAMYK